VPERARTPHRGSRQLLPNRRRVGPIPLSVAAQHGNVSVAQHGAVDVVVVQLVGLGDQHKSRNPFPDRRGRKQVACQRGGATLVVVAAELVVGVVEPRGELDGLPVEVDARLGQQSDRIEHLVQVSDRAVLAVRLRPAGQQVLSQFLGQVRVDLNPC
jgi:hypothetical protein